MDDTALDGWVAASLARLDEANTPPWTDARPESERTGTMTTTDEAIEENRRGYAGQMRWLKGKSLAEATHAQSQRASLERNEYNGGGNAATADYIERLRGTEGQQR